MLVGLSAYNSSSSDEESEKPVKNQKKKITLPKANYHSSDEDDEPSVKIPKRTDKPGLFAKLPPPRKTIGGGKQTNRPLIPYVFTKKPDTAKVATLKQKQKPAIEDDVDSSDNEDGVGFFSFVDKNDEITDEKSPADESAVTVAVNPVFTPETSSCSHANSVYSQPQTSQIQPESNHYYTPNFMPPLPNDEQAQANAAVSATRSLEKDERFKRIQGKGNRREKIEFIDINADTALEGNQQLLLQQLSEEKNIKRQSYSKKNKDAPSQQSRKKHQMSYLIHQAKEREIELKNAWAAGHAARQAARNRYGF